MDHSFLSLITRISMVIILSGACSTKKQTQQAIDLQSLGLKGGDIALCGADGGQFGTVDFNLSCSPDVKADFDLATSLLHSFEYAEAEKVFSKVINADPDCIMAYWGAAMCSFHPLWEAPGESDLRKGARIVAAGRMLPHSTTSRETEYLEAIATIYDNWEQIDYHTRLQLFEKASEKIYHDNPQDDEAAIFYALALRTSADPADKSFSNQKKAGQILNERFEKSPNHPGIAHYLIHTFDYPELAALALPAARKYASIAANSAHAQHMPSHIFTRLGLWDEAIDANVRSVAAAQCYAENLKIEGHWDEELHGIDYLVYAYLQQGNDEQARVQIEYMKQMNKFFPKNFKVAYALAAAPARYAMERREWPSATQLKLDSTLFPWEQFPWEKANVIFARLMGYVHINQLSAAQQELKELTSIHNQLKRSNENYKANLIYIQKNIGEGWIKFIQGDVGGAVALLLEAADLEDKTEKHPVTPGELVPARESLADLYLETGDATNALAAFESDLKKHPNRFNALYGAGRAAESLSDARRALQYYTTLINLTTASHCQRPELQRAKLFVSKNQKGVI